MASCFFRVIFTGPGYIPRPKDDREKTAGGIDPTVSADMFVCEAGGYPRWCRTCEIVKPDRAHHSRDSGRCVYKMGTLISRETDARPFLSLGRWNDWLHTIQILSAICLMDSDILLVCRWCSGTCIAFHGCANK